MVRYLFGVEDFTGMDAHAVHQAMIEAQFQAEERKERMPTSAKALHSLALALKIVRNKILARLPSSVAESYPPDAADRRKAETGL